MHIPIRTRTTTLVYRYTHDARNASICLECCNGINPWSRLTGTTATELCGCTDTDLVPLLGEAIVVYDVATRDVGEATPLRRANWPADAGVATYEAVVRAANATRAAMEARVHPKPDAGGAGTCTAGLPAHSRQPCCAGCSQGLLASSCQTSDHKECTCG